MQDRPDQQTPHRALRHLDLFSGIGGFALAARWTGQIETVAFCEIDPYCQQLLKKRWPHVPLFPDIRNLTKQALEQQGIPSVDLVTGGFPCQPFSSAGKRLGTADDRHLWPEMRRVIAQVRPRWIVAENVAHFVHLALDECLFDLEAAGYEAWTLLLPACSLGARHRRERVWILAHAASERHPPGPEEPDAQGTPQHQPADRRFPASDAGDRGVGRTDTRKSNQRTAAEESEHPWIEWQGADYCENLWTAEPPVDRVADGLPRRMDRLHALGNAIVPQVAYQLLMTLLGVEQSLPR